MLKCYLIHNQCYLFVTCVIELYNCYFATKLICHCSSVGIALISICFFVLFFIPFFVGAYVCIYFWWCSIQQNGNSIVTGVEAWKWRPLQLPAHTGNLKSTFFASKSLHINGWRKMKKNIILQSIWRIHNDTTNFSHRCGPFVTFMMGLLEPMERNESLSQFHLSVR